MKDLIAHQRQLTAWHQALEETPAILNTYRDRHRGERCVIIGNGPSLNRMDWSLFQDTPTFGLNKIFLLFYKMGFTPSYYVCVNPLVVEQNMEQIHQISAPKFLTAKNIRFVEKPAGIAFLNTFHTPRFFKDVTEGVYEGYTVTYTAMQLAYFMGFSQVVLIGVDHSYQYQGAPNTEVTSEGTDPNHFHPDYFGKGVRWHLPDLENSEKSYRMAKAAFEEDGRVILDATVGGKCTIFPKVDYRAIFASDAAVKHKFYSLPLPAQPARGQGRGPTLPPSGASPLVSAIVSTYNAESYLAGCLEDLEAQTIADRLEIIVINSGSPQNEEAIVRKYQQKYGNICYLRTEQRESVYQAWNRGIKLAHGQFLTNANTDDRHAPDAFEKMVQALQENPGAALVYTDQDYFKMEGDQRVFQFTRQREEYSHQRLFEDCLVGSQPMWRRSVHEEFGYFDEAFFTAGDYEFWLRIAQRYALVRLPEVLGERLLRDDSLELEGGSLRSYYETAVLQKCYEYARQQKLPVDQRGLSEHPIFTEWCELKLMQRGTRQRLAPQGAQPEQDIAMLRDWRPAQSSPSLSIVIATYRREQDLFENLARLEHQTEQNFEVIVVNNGPAIARLEESAPAFRYPLCSVRLKENFGPSLARNTGARLARAPIVAFLDDDAVAEDDWSEKILAHFAADEILGLRGKVLPKSTEPHLHIPVNYDLGDEPLINTAGIEMNSAFQREAFLQAGGFDENLFGFEGAELTYRVWLNNARDLSLVRYYPDILIRHDFATHPDRLIEVQMRNKAMKRALKKKWPEFPQYLAFHWGLLPQNRPENDPAWLIDAAQWCVDQDPRTAVAFAEQALAEHPFNYQVYLVLAQAHARLGSQPQAAAAYEMVIGQIEQVVHGEQNAHKVFSGPICKAYLQSATALAALYTGQEEVQLAAQSLLRVLEHRGRFAFEETILQNIRQMLRVLEGQPAAQPKPGLSAPAPAPVPLPVPKPAGAAVRHPLPAAPLVSAIVSTYNAERLLAGCLEDLEAQTIADQLEIIVVDSGSQQNERAIVEAFQRAYGNIRYLRTDQREGIYAAWNRGIRAAQGRFITNANTDDRHRPDALEILAAELQANPQVAVVYADVWVTGLENQTFAGHIRTGYQVRPDYEPAMMLTGCHMGPQPMWRRELHDQVGYFDERFRSAGDYEFWCRAACQHPMRHVRQFLGLYYENPSGLVNANLALSQQETEQVLRRYRGKLPAAAKDYRQNSPALKPGVDPSAYVNIGMVTFNRLEFTRQAIDALVRSTTYPYVLTVVDNGSTDGTVEYLGGLQKSGVIKNLVLLPENVGVAKASNLAWGLEPAAPYYLKWDNDIVVNKPRWLEDMVELVDAIPQLGAVAYNFEPQSYPLQTIRGYNLRIKHGLLTGNLGGACILLPRRTQEALGAWCEDYGLYGEEDSDMGCRIELAGLWNAYLEDEDMGTHLPAGKAALIDSRTLAAADGQEEQLHQAYRAWKDQARRRNHWGGLFQKNLRLYRSGRKPLFASSAFAARHLQQPEPQPAVSAAAGPRIAFYTQRDLLSPVRAGVPARQLGAHGFRVHILHDFDPQDVDWFDGFVFIRPHMLPALYPGYQACALSGKPVILDLDEDFFQMPPEHPGYTAVGPGNPPVLQTLEAMLRLATLVTVPTPELAETASRWAPRTRVIPNGWSSESPLWAEPPRHRNHLAIGWAGSPTHRADVNQIQDSLVRLLQEFPQTHLVIGGDEDAAQLFADLPRNRVSFEPLVDYHRYPALLAHFDILLAPLAENAFNQAKSDIKLVEAGARGIPWVASPTENYRAWGEGGLLAGTPAEWEHALRRLITDADLRRQLGAAGRRKAQTRSAEVIAQHWAALFDELLAPVAPSPAGQPTQDAAAAALLESILAAEDVAAALDQRSAELSPALLALVRANASAARADGDPDLAAGLDDLAEYIGDLLAERGIPIQ